MTIIILPLILLSIPLPVLMLVILVDKKKPGKIRKRILRGVLISISSILLLFIYWKVIGEIYAFTPMINYLFFLIIVPAVIALSIYYSNSVENKNFAQVLAVAVLTNCIIGILLGFIFVKFINLFELLNITKHY